MSSIQNTSININESIEIKTESEAKVVKLDPLTIEKQRLSTLPKTDTTLTMKSFALMFGDIFLQGTPYEGGEALGQAEYWGECIKSWQSDTYVGPCHPNLDKQTLNEISDYVIQYQQAINLFATGTPEEIRQFIQKNLSEKSKCVIPLATHGVRGKPGHVFACVLEKTSEGKLRASILNAGLGNSIHPIASIDTHVKLSYMFPPIEFDDPNFFVSELSGKFLKLISDYYRKEPDEELDPIEIYQLFLSLGRAQPQEIEEQHAKKSQRSGICPEEAMRLIHRNYFFKKGDITQLKHLIMCTKIQALYDIYSKLTLHPEEFDPEKNAMDIALIHRALDQFAFSSEKNLHRNPPAITQEEALTGQALIALIREKLPPLKEQSSSINNFATQGSTRYVSRIEEMEKAKEELKIKKKNEEELKIKKKNEEELKIQKKKAKKMKASGKTSDLTITKDFQIGSPKPEDVLSYLKQFQTMFTPTEKFDVTLGLFRDKDIERFALYKEKVLIIQEALKKLPVPDSANKEDFWKKIPKDERIEIMKTLSELTQHVNTAFVKDKVQAPLCYLTQLKSFAIIDALCRQNPKMKLENKSYDIDLEALSPYFYYLTGEDNTEFQKLSKYFIKKPNQDHIFNINEDEFGLNEGDETLIKNHDSSKKGIGIHLTYLDSILSRWNPKSSHVYFPIISKVHSLTDLSEEVVKKLSWFQSRDIERELKYIPEEYYYLQDAAFSSNGYISGKKLTPYLNSLNPYAGKSQDGHFQLRPRNNSGNIEFGIKEDWTFPENDDETICDGTEKLTKESQILYNDYAVKKGNTSENEIFAKIHDLEKHSKLSPRQVGELKEILRNPELRISLAMKFAQENSLLLQEPDIQFFLQYAFLNGTHLIEQIKNEPTTIHTMRQFFDLMINNSFLVFKPENVIFFTQLAMLAETHFAEATGKSTPLARTQFLLGQCDKILQLAKDAKGTFQSEKIESLLKHVYFTKSLIASLAKNSLDPDKDSELLSTLINNQILYNSYDSTIPIDPKLQAILKITSSKHTPSMEVFSYLNTLDTFKPAMDELGLNSEVKERTSVVLAWPTIVFKNVKDKEICLKFPLITEDNDQVFVGTWPPKMKEDPTLKKLLKGKYPPVFARGSNKVVAVDGSFEISYNGKTYDFKRQYTINGIAKFLDWAPLVSLDIDNLPAEFSKCEYWVDPDSKNIWILNEATQEPLACLISSQMCIQRTTSKWREIANEFLVQMEGTFLGKLFSKYCEPKNIVAWGTKEGEVKKVEIKELKLAFELKQVGDESKCLYEKNREYALDTKEVVNPLSSAIYLESLENPSKKGMILPFQKISSRPFHVKAVLSSGPPLFEEHFFYEFNVQTGLWRSPSQEAMLYLIYTLKSSGRFNEAVEYLKNFHPTAAFNVKQQNILKLILSDNYDVPDLSLAIKIYEAYQFSNKLIPFSKGKIDNPFSLENAELLASNIERLLKLMGDDLSLNRQYYSPTVHELKALVRQLPPLSPEIQNKLSRFTRRVVEEKTDEFKRTIPKLPSENALINIRRVLTEIKNDEKGFDFWNNFINYEENTIREELIYKGSHGVSGLARGYISSIFKTELTPLEQKALKLEATIIWNRLYEFTEKSDKNRGVEHYGQNIVVLYLILQFPNEFKTCVDKAGGINKSSMEAFTASKELQAFLQEIQIKHHSKSSGSSGMSSPLNLVEVKPEKTVLFALNSNQWKEDQKVFKVPLGEVLNRSLESSTHDILPETLKPFSLLSAKDKFEEGSLEREKIEELAKAYNEEVPKTYQQFQLKNNSNAEELSKNIETTIDKSKEKITQIENQIQRILESPSPEDLAHMTPEQQQAIYEFRNRFEQGKVERPDFKKHVFPSLLTQQPEIIRAANPFLSNAQIDKIYNLTIEYMLEHSKIDQANEALGLVKAAIKNPKNASALLDSAGHVLAKERHYNPYKYPGLLIYEYATGFMLRNSPDQAKLLKTIFKLVFAKNQDPKTKIQQLQRLFFEFQAGGGKTKVIAAIISAQALVEGMAPVFFSLPVHVGIVKGDLKSSLEQVYKFGVTPISIPLNKQLSLEEVALLQNLLSKGGSCILATPETWHSIKIQWELAMSQGEYQKAKALWEVTQFFKTNALFFIDEEHRNVSSHIEANNAAGKPTAYASYAIDVVEKAYDALWGWNEKPLKLSDGRDIHTVIDFAHNHQVSLLPKDKEEVLQVLAKYLIDELKIPIEEQEALLAYLTDKKVGPTPWLLDLRNGSEEKAKQIDLTKGLICTVLPHVLSQKDMIDYGPPKNLDDDVYDPYILGDPAGPKFQDADIAACITVQGLRQHGLNPSQMRRYLERTVQKFAQSQNASQHESIEFLNAFNALNPPLQYPLGKLEIRDLNNPELLDAFVKAIGKHPTVLKDYEKEIALKQVKVYPYKLSSTSQELSVGASAVIHTSATLGSPEMNPYLENADLFITAPAFMADVVQRALLPHNKNTHWIDESTPKQFFEDLYASKVDFSRVDGIINIGGMCKDASSNDWAEALLKFSDDHQLNYEGAVISREERIGDVLEKRLYIVRKGQSDVLIEGSDVKQALKKLGLSDKRFFKIYGPEMTTGTDLSLEPDAVMLFTLSENTPLSSTVQGIMRERQFLANPVNPETSQGLIWVGSTKMRELLNEKFKEASAESGMLWGISKELEVEKEAIKMRAIQDIEMVIRSLVEEIVGPHPEQYPEHRKAYEIDTGNDPTLKYGTSMTLEDTEKVLMKHAGDFAKAANISLEDHPEANNRIQRAIAQAKRKVSEIETGAMQNLSAMSFQQQHQEQTQEAEQQQQVLQEQHQMNMVAISKSPENEIDYANQKWKIGSNTFLTVEEEFQANQVLKTDLFSHNLYLLPNYSKTIQTKAPGDDMKPANFFLAVFNKQTGAKDYRVISGEDAKKYSKQLVESKGSDAHTAVVFTNRGAIHQSDRSKNGLSAKELEEWQHSEEFKSIVAQIGLINGELIESKNQYSVIHSNPQAMRLIRRIQDQHLLATDSKNRRNLNELNFVMLKKEAPSYSDEVEGIQEKLESSEALHATLKTEDIFKTKTIEKAPPPIEISLFQRVQRYIRSLLPF